MCVRSIVPVVVCVGTVQPVSSRVCYRDRSSGEEDFGICVVRLEEYADRGCLIYTTDTERCKPSGCQNVYVCVYAN